MIKGSTYSQCWADMAKKGMYRENSKVMILNLSNNIFSSKKPNTECQIFKEKTFPELNLAINF